jgi:hypothetical protein
VYDRDYGDQILSFEPSGALMNACLVMRDRETDSWWSMMSGEAIGGEMEGFPLMNMPAGEKIQWGDWRSRYPQTRVLIVEGSVHDERDPYEGYFTSDRGFRGLEAEDDRLPTKAPIFTFKIDGVSYAVSYERFAGGAVFQVADQEVFLFREADAPLFATTLAFSAPVFSSIEGNRIRFVQNLWYDLVTGAAFSPEDGFVSQNKDRRAPKRLPGLDTFWYIWSRTYEEGILLE